MGIISLFILSALAPMSLGYNVNKNVIKEPKSTSSNSGGLMDSAWPMYGHDVRHTGRSPNGISGNCLVEKWKVYFEREPIDTDSEPVIAKDGTIYITAGIGLDTLYAINPNGNIKWKYEAQGPYSESLYTPALAEDGTIYVQSGDGNFYALNPNGTEKWILKTGEAKSSPAIGEDGTIFVGGGHNLYAINPDGTIKWVFVTDASIGTSPAIFDNKIIYFASHDGYLFAIYMNNGTMKWKCMINDLGGCWSSPVIGDDDNIYVLGGYKLYGIYPNGTKIWKYINAGGMGPTIGFDDALYVGSSFGNLRAYTLDGQLKWNMDGIGVNSLASIDKNGMIYIGGGGRAYGKCRGRLFQISPEGKIYASILPSSDIPYSHCKIYTTPAIGENGTIYIGTYFNGKEGNNFWGSLHAFEVLNVENEPPNPPIINGPKGRLGLYTFTATTTDVDGDNVSFFFDWDDGVDQWTEFVPSGSPAKITHWFYPGIYWIEVRAQDVYGGMSDIVTKIITVPRIKQSQNIWHMRWLERFPILHRLLSLVRV